MPHSLRFNLWYLTKTEKVTRGRKSAFLLNWYCLLYITVLFTPPWIFHNCNLIGQVTNSGLVSRVDVVNSSLDLRTYRHSYSQKVPDITLELMVPIRLVVLRFPLIDFHTRPNILLWKVAIQPGFWNEEVCSYLKLLWLCCDFNRQDFFYCRWR